MALLFLLFFLIPVIVLVGMALRAAEVIKRDGGRGEERTTSSGTAVGAGFLASSGFGSGLHDDETWESETSDHISDDDDMMTDPAYSHLPWNIHDSSFDDDSTIGIDSEPDYFTDPIYSYMPGNIYYDDDDTIADHDTFSDDTGGISGTSLFDDDSISSFSSDDSMFSSFDDDWSSSSFDDSWGGSSFDD